MYACIYGQRSGLYTKRKALAKIIALFAYILHNANVLSAGAHFSGRAEVTTNASFLGVLYIQTRVIHGWLSGDSRVILLLFSGYLANLRLR